MKYKIILIFAVHLSVCLITDLKCTALLCEGETESGTQNSFPVTRCVVLCCVVLCCVVLCCVVLCCVVLCHMNGMQLYKLSAIELAAKIV